MTQARAARTSAASLNPRVADWRGRRVCIVGASTGIGAATAELLAARGTRLALSSRSEARLREIVAGLEAGRFDIHFPKRVTRFLKLLRLLPCRLHFPRLRKGTGR